MCTRLASMLLVMGSLLHAAHLRAESPPGLERPLDGARDDIVFGEPESWLGIDSLLRPFPLRWPDLRENTRSSDWNLESEIRRVNAEAYLRLTQGGTGGLFVDRDDDLPGDDDGPDITKPGPDMGDYPNSAYTLRQGRMQLEMAPISMRTKNTHNSSASATPFLFRYGVTSDVEFRVLGTGLTNLISPQQITGFGVITLDTKVHLWNDNMQYWIPAVSFEATLQTQWGSPAFQAGTEPGMNLNMDFPFSDRTNFEMTLGYTGNQTDLNLVTRAATGSAIDDTSTTNIQVNQNLYVMSLQWALEQEVTDQFEVFLHGYLSQTVGVGNSFGTVIGAGFFYKVSKEMMIFGSANAGLTDIPAPFLSQLGVAYIF